MFKLCQSGLCLDALELAYFIRRAHKALEGHADVAVQVRRALMFVALHSGLSFVSEMSVEGNTPPAPAVPDAFDDLDDRSNTELKHWTHTTKLNALWLAWYGAMIDDPKTRYREMNLDVLHGILCCGLGPALGMLDAELDRDEAEEHFHYFCTTGVTEEDKDRLVDVVIAVADQLEEFDAEARAKEKWFLVDGHPTFVSRPPYSPQTFLDAAKDCWFADDAEVAEAVRPTYVFHSLLTRPVVSTLSSVWALFNSESYAASAEPKS